MAPDAWADDNLCRLVALKQLHLTLSPEKLNRLLSRHVSPEDGYPSESLLHHLVTLPLEPSVVTTFVKNLGLDIPIEKLIPLFDGESDPFPVQRWEDLARLPALEDLTAGHPLPTPEVLAAHFRLRRLRVPRPNCRRGWRRSEPAATPQSSPVHG